MTKTITLIIAICLLIIIQANAQYTIKPGIGFDKIKIGMQIKDIIELLGEPDSQNDFESEGAGWVESGHDTSKELVFIIGFDDVYEFNDNKYCLWKVFVKNNVAVYLTISSYVFEGDFNKEIKIGKKLFVFDNTKKIINKLGKDFIEEIDSDESVFYHYLDQGISFYIDNDELRVIYVYQPFKGSAKERIGGLIKNSLLND